MGILFFLFHHENLLRQYFDMSKSFIRIDYQDKCKSKMEQKLQQGAKQNIQLHLR